MTNLIVISSEADLENETFLVNDLFREGMELFHLRKPGWDAGMQRKFLEQVDSRFYSRISVHQHHETITEFGLEYYHVKESDRKLVLRVKNKHLKYSTTFHVYNDLQFESIFWNYCFLSPVFDSISKPGYKSGFQKDFTIEGDLNPRVFALGGIDKTNIDLVFKKEFYGAAVLGAVWNEPAKAVVTFRELNAICRQNVHTY